MTTEEIQARVLAIVGELMCLPVNKIPVEESLSNLGVDSLDALEIVMDIEHEWEIKIPDVDSDRLASGTVGGLVEYVVGRKVKVRK